MFCQQAASLAGLSGLMAGEAGVRGGSEGWPWSGASPAASADWGHSAGCERHNAPLEAANGSATGSAVRMSDDRRGIVLTMVDRSNDT